MDYKNRKLEWLEFDLLEPYPHIIHGVFMRHGGTSEGPFSSLNLSDRVGDHPDSLKANRETVRKATELPRIIYANQNHGAIVQRIRIGKNDEKIPVADALFTTEKNLGLAVTHADCQAAIFYDPVHEAVGVAHAGWKGIAQDIYGRMVETMNREIGTQAQNLIVCISPSLGPDHAEHKNYRQELPQEFWECQTKPNYFDFWEISKRQLARAGILEKNIEIAGQCTFCEKESYFSYRREKETGRNATIVALKG